jgi:hypothetical protein
MQVKPTIWRRSSQRMGWAIREKLEQKVSNVNRTRREFSEMIVDDDIDNVKERLVPLVNIFKTSGRRPGALEKVKEAMAEMEQFVETHRMWALNTKTFFLICPFYHLAWFCGAWGY